MTLPSNGYIEINDTKSKIRGMMAGVDGTFSGTFAALNANAVESINIRDGAVNAFYGFNFPRGSTEVSFTVPHQPYARVAEIILPIEVYEEGNNGGSAEVAIYKNGVLLDQQRITAAAGYGYAGSIIGIESGYRLADTYKVWYLQSARIMDFNLMGAATYTVTFKSGRRSRALVSELWVYGQVALTFQGQVTVGFRKR